MSTHRRREIVAVLLLSAGSTAACQDTPPFEPSAVPAASCMAVTDALPATTDLTPLRGVFELAVVAASGPRAGLEPIVASVSLRPQESSLVSLSEEATRTVAQPFIGASDIDPAALGAALLGSTSSMAPAQPGVAVYAARDAAGALVGLVARIGSLSNSRGPASIEGEHFTLFINRVAAGGFHGTWVSEHGAGMNATVVRGHFCASRRWTDVLALPPRETRCTAVNGVAPACDRSECSCQRRPQR